MTNSLKIMSLKIGTQSCTPVHPFWFLLCFRKHEFFQQWPKDKLERLCFESRIEEIMHGRVVDANTADTDSLYFILKVTYYPLAKSTSSSVCISW